MKQYHYYITTQDNKKINPNNFWTQYSSCPPSEEDNLKIKELHKTWSFLNKFIIDSFIHAAILNYFLNIVIINISLIVII